MTHPDLITVSALCLAAYLLGAIPFGLLITKLRGGGDIREAGSGNIGAANVTRVAGAGAGVVTLLLDAGKGYLAVWLTARYSNENIAWMLLAALAAIAGHIFPVWLGFRGGKGVATAAGAFLTICSTAILAAGLVFLLVVLFWRYVSLASISAAASLPLLVYLLYAPGLAPPHIVSIGVTFAAVVIILRHRKNIERLINGTETRLTFRHHS
jgi:glycerol-3-phosphate acyltransferase PlsY